MDIGLSQSPRARPPRKATRGDLLKSLPPFPAVARELLKIIDKDSCTIPDVARVIKTDAAFSTEVLRLSNSAMLGLRYEVTNILHGVSVLGMNRLRGLVLTIAMRNMVSGSQSEPAMRRCWRHNLATALVAEWLAEPCWLDKGEAYTAGLLHDLGILALAALYPKPFESILAQCESSTTPSRARMRELEKANLGATHVEAASWLAEEWGLPQVIRAVLARAEDPTPENPTNHSALANLSCDIADAIGFPIVEPREGVPPVALVEILPPDLAKTVQPRLHELAEGVPFKVNAFECEFMN
ncbi:MAG: HDOD domain-containing protein [Bryobacteraceae bacterium]